MQSKTSFFNKTLFAKNIKRFWPLWALTTLLLCIGPITTLISSRNIMMYGYTTVKAQTVLVDITCEFVPIYLLIMSCITAMCVWNYLFDRKSAYSLHALPCTRTEMFITNYLSGLVIILIPSLIAGLLEIIAVTNAYEFSAYGIAALLGIGLIDTIFFFSFASFVAMIVGHIAALPAFYLFFNFIAVLVESEFNFLISGYCPGVAETYNNVLGFLAPVIWLYDNSRMDYGSNSARVAYIDNIPKVFVLLLVAAAFVALSLFVYNKKSIERAGQAISVGVLKPVMLGLVTVVGTIGGGAIFTFILESGETDTLYNIMPQEIVFMLISAAVVFFLALVIINGTIRVFNLKNFKLFGIVAVAVIALNVLLNLDPLRLTYRVPDIEDVDRVSVNIDYSGSSVLTDEEDIELAMATHKAMAAIAKERNRKYYSYSYDSITPDAFENTNREIAGTSVVSTSVDFYYTLKNGRTLVRKYYAYALDLSQVETECTVENCLYKLDKNYERLYSMLHIDDSDVAVSSIWLDTYGITDEMIEIPAKSNEAVIAAIMKDMEEETMTSYHWYENGDYYLYLSVDFHHKEDNVYVRQAYFWITENNKHTVKALLDEGIVTEELLDKCLNNNINNTGIRQ